MKPRRSKGATLGLVAVSVLVIIIIGVGCFFLAKICGGGREVANATDAGALNVAKNALRSAQTTVTIPKGSDFYNLIDNDPSGRFSGINLYTYNRVVGQALLVALNAQEEGTQYAILNNTSVWTELQQIGSNLKGKLVPSAWANSAFSQTSGANSTKMYGGSSVNFSNSDYKTALMKPTGSTNIYFLPATFGNVLTPPANLTATGNTNVIFAPQGGRYMQGYVANSVMNKDYIGVPVFPTQQPHLVNLQDFTSGAKVYNDPTSPQWTPPNSFKCLSTAADSKSGTVGGAVACAIVGSVASQSQNLPADFLGCIPSGYLWIHNEAGAIIPSNWSGPMDNSNNVFNWELNGANGGIDMANNQVFDRPSDTTSGNGMGDWIKYNQAVANQGPPTTPPTPLTWVDTTGTTRTAAPSSNGFFIAQGPNASQAATPADMQGITNNTNCYTDLMAGTWNAGQACFDDINAYAARYGRTLPQMGPLPNLPSSLADAAKLDLLNTFNGPHPYSTTVNGATLPGHAGEMSSMPPNVSGFGVMKPITSGQPTRSWTAQGSSPTNNHLFPLEDMSGNVSNPFALLSQIGGTCATQSVLQDIMQRCNEISPGYIKNIGQVQAMLQQYPLLINGNLYIYNDKPTNIANGVHIFQAPPAWVQVNGNGEPTNPLNGRTVCDANGVTPVLDGPPNTTVCNGNPVSLGSDDLVDTFSTDGVAGGDDNLHEAPYLHRSGDISTTDHAEFRRSSGFQNLLGQLDFYQTSAGSETFSRPN